MNELDFYVAFLQDKSFPGGRELERLEAV